MKEKVIESDGADTFGALLSRTPRFGFSIGYRLFAAVLLSFLIVGAAGVELIRWKLFDNFSEHVARVEVHRLDGLVAEVAKQYQLHRGWTFLPSDVTQRKHWLRDELLRTEAGLTNVAGPAASFNLGDRLGVMDADRRLLAGVKASRFLVAAASVDTVERELIVDGASVGHLVLARPQNPDDEPAVAFRLEQQHNLAALIGIGALLSLLVSALLAAHFRKPIHQMVQGAHELEKGRFDVRLPTGRSDELGRLGESFNRLAARFEDIERSRRQWMADTSHELRTPLSVMQAQMEALRDGIRPATPDNMALMLDHIRALNELVDDLHDLTGQDTGTLRYVRLPIDVWQLVADVAAGFADKMREAKLSLNLRLPPSPAAIVIGDRLRVRQVLSNLLENSVRHTDAGGRIDIAGRIAGDAVQVSIEDSAPGVSGEDMARLGERFFRTEASRNRAYGGRGLGLAISRRIVEAHGGRLNFRSAKHGGLGVDLFLPLPP